MLNSNITARVSESASVNAASAHDRTSAGTIIQDFVARRDPGYR